MNREQKTNTHAKNDSDAQQERPGHTHTHRVKQGPKHTNGLRHIESKRPGWGKGEKETKPHTKNERKKAKGET